MSISTSQAACASRSPRPILPPRPRSSPRSAMRRSRLTRSSSARCRCRARSARSRNAPPASRRHRSSASAAPSCPRPRAARPAPMRASPSRASAALQTWSLTSPNAASDGPSSGPPPGIADPSSTLPKGAARTCGPVSNHGQLSPPRLATTIARATDLGRRSSRIARPPGALGESVSLSSGPDTPRPPPHPFDEMWYVLVDNRTIGPRASLAKVGSQQWTPIGDVPAFASLLAREGVASGAAGPPRQLPMATSYASSPYGVHFAGFWIRVAAYFIDAIVQSVISLVIGIIVGLAAGRPGGAQSAAAIAQGLAIVVQFVIVFAYQAIFVSGSWQATPGKRLCGIYIIRVDGRKIGVGLAVGRYLAIWVSALTLYIGFMMAGWTAQKKALHDMICNTRVIYGRAEDAVPLAEIFD